MKENTNEKSDNIAAIGIGAMIVFIALILVAAVAAAVIIQTAEKLQQNAQTTGEETTSLLSSKVMVKNVIIPSAGALYITFELAPGSDSITSSLVAWVIVCGTTGIDSGDFAGSTVVGAAVAQATLNPGTTYDVTIPAGDLGTCGPSANQDHVLSIQSGSGGTEAQDWVAMLLRMYLRWLDSKNFKHEVVELSEGEVAGYKSATIKVNGEYAYGWLRTETGVHRLVRKSPFDSGNRRHTSFASVFAYPQINENINIQINPSDLRVDVYRASGAGGQHVNTTESAVRITHLPTKIVTQCQNGRSQHKNKESAMKQLRAKLYLFEIDKKNEIKNKVESQKSDISWGNQIRSYILDDSRIKDLRTNHETGNTQAVLDGDLDAFVEKSLKEGF